MKLSYNTKGTLVVLVIFLAAAMFAIGYRVCELINF